MIASEGYDGLLVIRVSYDLSDINGIEKSEDIQCKHDVKETFRTCRKLLLQQDSTSRSKEKLKMIWCWKP